MSEKIISVERVPDGIRYLTLSDAQANHIRRAAAMLPGLVRYLAEVLLPHRRRIDAPPAKANPKRAAQKAQPIARRIARQARR